VRVGRASQLDIAPTVAAAYGLSYRCEGRVIAEAARLVRGRRMALLIIDALGYREFLRYGGRLGPLASLASSGLTYKCSVVARLTTPAIASILCGLKPARHRIYTTGDVYRSGIVSLPEFLSLGGVRSGVVMESEGANTFRGKVDFVAPVKDREDIVSFDLEVVERVLDAASSGVRFVVAHVRSLDKLGYVDRALDCLSRCLRTLLSLEGWGLVVCGDHPPHGSRQRYVPLIFGVLGRGGT